MKDGPVLTHRRLFLRRLGRPLLRRRVSAAKTTRTIKVEVIKDDVPPAPAGKEEMRVGVEVGGDSVNRFTLFVGPKDIDLLRRVDPKLQQLIDWGWYGVIAKPLFLAMHWLNDNFVHNYGWSIVLITIAINLVLLPLRFKSMKSQRKMQSLQPQDRRHQRQIQGPQHARSQEGRAEPGSDGASTKRKASIPWAAACPWWSSFR